MAIENRLNTIRFLVLLVGILYPGLIGPEILPKGGVPGPDLSKNTTPRHLGKTSKKAEMTPESLDNLNRQAFLSAFLRQSRLGLTSCLQQSGLESKSFALKARLTKLGTLENLENLESVAIVLPDCAEQIIKAMNFAHLTKSWQSPSKIVYWRIDW